jgi:superfamily II DNA or RNA helicase
MELKPHQQQAIATILKRLDEGANSQLAALPTGTGKTFLAVALSRSFERTLFVCHREELLRQTAETFNRVHPGLPVGFVAPGRHEIEAPFTVAMIQTLHRRKAKIDPAHFDLLVIDEAHHAMARTWRETAEHFEPKLRLGLSATPERLDGLSLETLFGEISFEMGIADAIEQGYLVPVLARQCLTSCSLEGVRTKAGDLNEQDLAKAIDNPLRNQFIVSKFQEHCAGRRAICFAVNLEHAANIADAFVDSGIPAAWISGACTDRAEKLQRFAAGEIQVMISVQVLTEGFDDPAVSAVLMARPTASRSLFCQMAGRALRLYPDKQNAVLLDFVDVAGKHRLASAWRFMGYTRPPKPGDDEPMTIGGEKKRRESTVISVDADRPICLLTPPPDIPDGFEYGACAWHFEPPTERQLQFLSELGYNVQETDFSRGQASAIISAQPPSANQLRLLANLGYDTSRDWTRAQASAAFEESKTKAMSLVKRIRKAGFQIEADGHVVKVEPYGRLTPVQRDWLNRNRSGLLLALRE